MKIILVILFVIAILSGVGFLYLQLPYISEEDFTSIDTSRDPEQYPLFDQADVLLISKGLEATIEPFAQYKVSAVILSRKRYASEWASIISPIDFALGWGDVSKPENLEHIEVRQTLRWYRYRYGKECSLSQKYISTHTSNHHIIPANENVRKAVLSARKNDKIVLEGFLVNVAGSYKNGNVSWRSSKSRTDTGDGSCEIMYVKSVKIDTNIYR